MKSARFVMLALAALIVLPLAALGHHSPAAYDVRPEAQIALDGTVQQVQWTNPHVYILLETAGAGSGTAVWRIEVDAPSNMERHGWSRDSLVAGDHVSAEVFPGRKPGELIGKLFSATKDDGTVLSYIDPATFDLEAPRNKRARSLSGVWAPDPLPADSTATRIQEALIRASYGLQTDVPLTAKGLAAVQSFSDDQSPTVDCVPRTAPSTTMYSSGLHAIEVSKDAVILRENWFGTERVVHLDVDSHDDARYSIQGHSIGHFEGDTLVVETERFTPHREGLFNKLPSSRGKILDERFELNDDGQSLTYRWEVTDPDYLAAPVSGESRWTYRPDLEFATVECSVESAQRFLSD